MKRSYKKKPWQDRFWGRVNKTTGCWLWTGGTTNGYGELSKDGVSQRTNRLSWEIHFGKPPSHLHVCHTCDNPLCVNPRHLFLGTDLDNNRDMRAKNRGSTPPLHKGQTHPNAKITDAQAAEIRESTLSATSLASRYGISLSQAFNIKAGRQRTL